MIKYPFTPKSNRKLEIGQFWAIKLNNNKYGCGIILDLPSKDAKSTKMCFIGLLDWVGTNKPTQLDLESVPLELLDQGKAHIKTIIGKGEPIIGKIDLFNSSIDIPFELDCAHSGWVVNGYTLIRKANYEDERKYKTQTTWGYEVLYLLAEKLLVVL